jgi:hypothetical protein
MVKKIKAEKKVIFLCNFKNFGYETLSALVNDKVKPLLLAYVHDEDRKPLIKYSDSNSILMSSRQLVNGDFPIDLYNQGYSPTSVDSDILRKMSECERILIPMMERQNFFKLSSLQISNYYYKYIATWNGIFSALKPDAIVFHNTPHEGFNFVAYSLAKIYGIKTIMPERTLIKDRMFILHNIYQFPKYDNSYFTNTKINNEFLKDIQKMTKKNSSLPKNSNIFLRISKLGKLFDKVNDPVFYLGNKTVRRWKLEFYIIIAKYKIYKIKKWSKVNNIRADFDDKYIYFPLQIQPERTTLPMGGLYWNSLNVLNTLICCLPKGWKIYIKEHPRQFARSMIDANLARDIDFYKELIKDDRVKLINTEESAAKLSKNSQCVATVTGTAGWESISNGIPSIIFGYPWYYECPEIYKVGALNDLKKYLNKIDLKTVIVNRKKVSSYASWIEASSGYVGSLSPANISALSKTENSYKISNAILENL